MSIVPALWRNRALVLVAHGSTLNPDSSAPTLDLAASIRNDRIFAEVAVAFWKEEPSCRDVFRMIESEVIYVLPNFISEGYFTETVIPRELGLDGTVTKLADGRTVLCCEPTGSHPSMTDLLLHRARATAPNVSPKETSLVIVGHGTGLTSKSAVAARSRAEEIAALGIFGEVLPAYMEEAPLISDWDQLTQCPNVVVVPFFIADGLHSFQDIPVLLGIENEGEPAASQRQIFRKNPHHLRNRTLYYSNAVGTDPQIKQVALDQIAARDTP